MDGIQDLNTRGFEHGVGAIVNHELAHAQGLRSQVHKLRKVADVVVGVVNDASAKLPNDATFVGEGVIATA